MVDMPALSLDVRATRVGTVHVASILTVNIDNRASKSNHYHEDSISQLVSVWQGVSAANRQGKSRVSLPGVWVLASIWSLVSW